MYFAVITSHGIAIQEPADQMIEKTLSRLPFLSTKAQVRWAIGEAFQELAGETKAQTVGLDSSHA
jgi:hypothetical protein